ncbi:MAG: hypothetical protein VW397_04200 [Candidatus Margulisiibacteriota bacterium]
MARKINGPFGDVSIYTHGQQGSTTTNEDVFFNLIHSEMNLYADEFSSAQRTRIVDKITQLGKAKKSTPSTREETQNLDPFIDILGPSGFQNKLY